ncbi:MAG: hypothetical protein RAK17_05945, partial [Caldisphaera sp.]|nr:hypothetical protein [Caldisphaera sp.]
MDLAVLKEGKAILYVPETKNAMIKPGIIEPSHLPVFYNPVMIFNRDVSMVSLSSFIEVYWPGKKLNAIDALSATGVRGIRYSLEVSNLSELIINDNDPLAYEIMLKNIKLNKVEDKVKAYKREANSLMRSLKFEENKPINIIDLDPFGSIIPFIDSAISISSKGSLLALTATDLAVIGGSKFRAAKRKYQVNLINTKHYREIAVRALIAYIAKISAAYDRSIIPLLSYSSDHYARLYLLIDKGAKKAENMLEKEIGYFILYNGLMEFADNYSEKILGPIWKGEIINKDFAVNIYNNLINNYKYLESY